MAKVTRGRQAYYLATVAAGREHDGGLIERDGVWLGNGAALLGLSGAVDGADLEAVLSGRDPATGELVSPSHGRVVVVGIDCTFSAPKSVSLLHALGPENAVSETASSHDAAVAHTLAFLEDEAGRSRRKSQSTVESVRVEGLTVAAFLHRTSRAPDPHLHTHMIVANCGRGSDGRWSALDCRALFAGCGTASALYESHLRHEIGQRLGLRFLERDGIASRRGYDVEGFDRAMMRAFSRRSADIEEHLTSHGFSGPRARRIAALATRPPKNLGVAYEELVAGWRETSITLGIPVGHVGRVVGKGRERLNIYRHVDTGGVGSARDAAELDRLTARRASFSRDELVKALCRSQPEGASVQEISSRVATLLASGTVVERAAVPHFLQARDGHWFPAGTVHERFTTPTVIATEEQIVSLARARRSSGLGVATERSHADALAARPSLDNKTRDAVTALVSSGHGIELLTGDTAPDWPMTLRRYDVLDAACEAWTADGTRVIGVAANRRASERLEAATAIETTAASFVWDANGIRPSLVPSNAVIVVAGADRLGPRRLANLCEMAAEQESKVVLLHDADLNRPDSRPLALIRDDALAIRIESRPMAESGAGRPIPQWLEVDGVTVGLARSFAGARQAALEVCAAKRSGGTNALLVCGDRAIAQELAAAGPVISPQDLPEMLAMQRSASLVVFGEAVSLPAAVRRRTTIDRVHVVVDRHRDLPGRAERALEVGLPPRITRQLGAPRRTADDREHWRVQAREHLQASLERGVSGRSPARELAVPPKRLSRGLEGPAR